MNERPIIFSTEMICKILSGQKTQTRRVIKPQPDTGILCAAPDEDENWIFWDTPFSDALARFTLKAYPKGNGRGFKCPYGVPGDHLWVRETWAAMCKVADPICFCSEDDDFTRNHYFEYRADSGNPYPGEWPIDEARGNPDAPKWKPSILMPKSICRLWCEVVNVRVERVQEISDSDAKAEGVSPHPHTNVDPYRAAFCGIWDEINEKRGFGWLDNPFVWVVDFRRIE